jgi:hypothetical protein
MGRREEKGRAVARYILGQTGIPFVSWVKGENIEAPFPYRFNLITAASVQRFAEAMKKNVTGLNIVIRYDGFIDDIEQAWVAMPLRDAIVLLKAHHDTIQDRINTEGA